MRRLISFAFVLLFVLGLSGCNDTAEIQIDNIVMLHASDGEITFEKVTITDKKTISELLAMYNSLETTGITSPLADDRMKIIFYKGDEVEFEWCISAYKNHWINSEFISNSTLWSEGNQAVTSDFDYSRLLEIFSDANS